jgi:hypothetical protein
MSDDEEMEQFGMNDEDMERMLNPGGFWRKKQTKEEAMLGIWASSSRAGGVENSSEEEEDEFSYRNQSRKKSTGNVNFVPSSKKVIKPTDFKKKEASDEDSRPSKDDLEISDEDDFDDKKGYKV